MITPFGCNGLVHWIRIIVDDITVSVGGSTKTGIDSAVINEVSGLIVPPAEFDTPTYTRYGVNGVNSVTVYENANPVKTARVL